MIKYIEKQLALYPIMEISYCKSGNVTPQKKHKPNNNQNNNNNNTFAQMFNLYSAHCL